MKREEILAMEPGWKLDRIVALKVMGFQESELNDGWVRMGVLVTPPKRYSTNITAAWEVVEKVKSMLFSKRTGFLKELQTLTKKDSEYYIAWPDVFWTINPERICKAALLTALEEEQA